jgi:hypothetical protein
LEEDHPDGRVPEENAHRLWTHNVHPTNDVVAVMIGDSEYEDRAAVQGKKQLVKPDKKKKQSSGTLLPLGLCR